MLRFRTSIIEEGMLRGLVSEVARVFRPLVKCGGYGAGSENGSDQLSMSFEGQGASAVLVDCIAFKIAPVCSSHFGAALRSAALAYNTQIKLSSECAENLPSGYKNMGVEGPPLFEVDANWGNKLMTLELALHSPVTKSFRDAAFATLQTWAYFASMGGFSGHLDMQNEIDELEVCGIACDATVEGIDWLSWGLSSVAVSREALPVLLNAIIHLDGKFNQQICSLRLG